MLRVYFMNPSNNSLRQSVYLAVNSNYAILFAGKEYANFTRVLRILRVRIHTK